MLRIDDAGGVRTLTLDRPERLNALTPALISRLNNALLDCTRDPGVRAVVLAGAGRGFCSGFDLSGEGGEPDPIADRWKAEDPAVWWSKEQVTSRMLLDAQTP